ncbi:MAG TPA: PKD domain-containing protein [Bacteroidia bacterium]|jgi:PKD repeat protein|nr:PKD domain-containing protein [Bacteroidia bacterium]
MKHIRRISIAFLIALFCGGLGGCAKKPAAPTAPTNTFTFSPASPKAGQTVTFTFTGSGAVSYAWSFGDGSGSSFAENPTYVYSVAGTYPVSLTVTNAVGSASTTNTVTVTP